MDRILLVGGSSEGYHITENYTPVELDKGGDSRFKKPRPGVPKRFYVAGEHGPEAYHLEKIFYFAGIYLIYRHESLSGSQALEALFAGISPKGELTLPINTGD